MYEYAAISDIGPKANINDDRILVNGKILDSGLINGKIIEPYTILAVADGVGGLQRGYEAAEMTLHTIADLNKPGLGRQDIRNAVECANKSVIQKQVEMNNPNALRTTLAAVYISESDCYVVNAGDSRVYRLRDGELVQLSKDHSVVQNMIDTGELNIDESYSHPKRNVITKCLGDESRVNARIVDYSDDIQINDLFVICSDGISDCLRDYEIANIVADLRISLQDACRKLVNKAIDNGSTDNISVCLLRKEN